MSEAVEGQNQMPEGEQAREQLPNVDVKGLISRLDQLEKSNARILDESKMWKSKYQSVRTEVEQKEKEVLEQNNDFKGLYERTLAQVNELKGQVTSLTEDKYGTALKYEVAKYGKDAEDMEILEAAVKTKKRDLVGIDKETGQWRGVDLAVEELRKSHPGLFSQMTPGHESGRPNAIVPQEKTLDERINEDPSGFLRESLKNFLS